jgi:hypothetical protein
LNEYKVTLPIPFEVKLHRLHRSSVAVQNKILQEMTTPISTAPLGETEGLTELQQVLRSLGRTSVEAIKCDVQNQLNVTIYMRT